MFGPLNPRYLGFERPGWRKREAYPSLINPAKLHFLSHIDRAVKAIKQCFTVECLGPFRWSPCLSLVLFTRVDTSAFHAMLTYRINYAQTK